MNAQISTDFKQLIESPNAKLFAKYLFDHHSPSQLNLPEGHWSWKYFCCTQEIRRNFKFGAKPRLGVAIGGQVAWVYGDIIWTFNSEKIINKNKLTFKQYLKEVDVELLQYNPMFDDKEVAQHAYHKKIAHRVCYNLFKAIRSLSLQGTIESEANRYYNVGTEIDLLGRTDLENETCIIEIKILPPRRGKLKKDGTYGFSTQSIKEPKLDHARQLSFYWAATGKRPFLVYANEKEYTIFDPSNSDLLTETAMKDHLKFYKSKAKLRENLLIQADGDINKLLSLVNPDWEHPFYWDIGDEFVEQAKRDFNKAMEG
tara:strand:- start:801 stop:1742 length:942 start_codon:yes stop_codon:yes gene_type:complete